MAVVVARRRGHAGLARLDQLQGLRGTADGGLADLVGVGKAGHLAGYPAQTEARIHAVIGHLEAAIVEHEALVGAVLQVELAIVASAQHIAGDAQRGLRIKLAGAVEKAARVLNGHASDIGGGSRQRKRQLQAEASDFLAAMLGLVLLGDTRLGHRAVSGAADEHEMPVAIAAIDPAHRLGNFQPDARMPSAAEISPAPVAGDARQGGADGFGRFDHGAAAISNAQAAAQS